MKKLILDGTGSTVNNVIKALLIGFIAGALIGFTGTNWDFDVSKITSTSTENLYSFTRPYSSSSSYSAYGNYGWAQAIFTGLIVSGLLFLRYNKKEN